MARDPENWVALKVPSRRDLVTGKNAAVASTSDALAADIIALFWHDGPCPADRVALRLQACSAPARRGAGLCVEGLE